MINKNPTIAPYGSWRSPITADAIVAESISIGQVAIDGDAILWTEGRPSEGGRNVIVRMTPDGTVADVNPAPFNARTRVHEYGGGAWIADGGTVWFSNFDDQRIYRLEPDGEPQPITPDAPLRYADATLDRRRNRLICVREDHSDPGNIINAIAAVPADEPGEQVVLFDGWDFVSSPRLSPDGGTLAWLSWDHPNMPWDGTHLWTRPCWTMARWARRRWWPAASTCRCFSRNGRPMACCTTCPRSRAGGTSTAWATTGRRLCTATTPSTPVRSGRSPAAPTGSPATVTSCAR